MHGIVIKSKLKYARNRMNECCPGCHKIYAFVMFGVGTNCVNETSYFTATTSISL